MGRDEYTDQARRQRHKYYMRRREKALAYQRQYDREHKDKRKAYMAEYRKRNKNHSDKDPEE